MEVGLVAEARPLEHACQEPEAAIVHVWRNASVLSEGANGHAAVGLWPAARVVHEVHAAWAAHNAEGGQGKWKEYDEENVNLLQAMEPGEDLVSAELHGFAKNAGGCDWHDEDEEEVVHNQLVEWF